MDYNKYIKTTNELFLHRYGEKNQLWKSLYEFHELNMLQTDIILKCDGKNTINDIWKYIQNKYEIENSEENRRLFESVIEKFLHNNFISLTDISENKEIYVTGKEKMYYPVWLICEITNMCNCKCHHCYKDAKFTGSTLDLSLFYKLCDTFKEKTPRIVLTGGEPFIHPNIQEIIENSTKYFETSILTNGLLIDKVDPDVLRKIKRIQISLYGYDNKSYSNFTGCANGFSMLKKSFNILDKCEKVERLVTLVITKENVDELEKYIKAAIELNALALKFGLSFPLGRASNEKKLYKFSEQENEKLYYTIAELREKYKEKISISEFNNIQKTNPLNIKGFGCQAGKTQIVINEKGNIRPCNMLPSEVFRKYTFEEYVEEIEMGHERVYDQDLIILRETMKKEGNKPEDMKCAGFCNFK